MSNIDEEEVEENVLDKLGIFILFFKEANMKENNNYNKKKIWNKKLNKKNLKVVPIFWKSKNKTKRRTKCSKIMARKLNFRLKTKCPV